MSSGRTVDRWADYFERTSDTSNCISPQQLNQFLTKMENQTQNFKQVQSLDISGKLKPVDAAHATTGDY